MSRDTSITVTRRVLLPDDRKLARLARSPELGPNILFFSGGSALNPLCRVLVRFTHNSTHLITPFDSGGSSATLRRAFNMPAVGDLRNRMMALADRSVWGNPEVGRLFATRLDKNLPPEELKAKLEALVQGDDPLVADIPDPLRKIVRTHLGFAAEALPPDFDLRGSQPGQPGAGGRLPQPGPPPGPGDLHVRQAGHGARRGAPGGEPGPAAGRPPGRRQHRWWASI